MRITVPLRLNRTVMTAAAGEIVSGYAPGGIPVDVKRLDDSYQLLIAGQTYSIVFGGSIAVEVRGFPYVVQSKGSSLLWVPHYRAEGVLPAGPCRAEVVVSNGRMAIDLYGSGLIEARNPFPFCGYLVNRESAEADGSSITFLAAQLAPKLGEPIPPLTLETLDGQVIDANQPRSRPLLLDFWAAWCSVCIHEFAPLEAVYASGAADIVSINIDDPPFAEAARAVIREHNPSWPQVLTGQGIATSGWQEFQSFTDSGSMPLYALIDRWGVLRYIGSGGGTKLPEIHRALRELAAQ